MVKWETKAICVLSVKLCHFKELPGLGSYRDGDYENISPVSLQNH